ncbi:hypothetical protein [Streptomyces sp. NBC_01006]|uniref:hypothetical protein n=1 Tax=Streptomyces sp. NBC_01006 TaxID=2903716 RepID=UPI002F90951B|nr:hypothetical protein OG509_41380 [Streptomyces sp. NBC_01006]
MGGAKKDDKRFVLQGAGPAQSDTLVHFTSRGENASFTPKVPEKFRQMTAQERLDSILGSGRLYGYPSFGAQQTCVCFSESPQDHLAHLIADRGFGPWGVVVTRVGVLSHDGGAVAYVTDDVYKRFVDAGLGPIATGYRNGYTGEQAYPNDPAAIPVTELPEMWRESDVWVWNREARSMDKYPAGVLV